MVLTQSFESPEELALFSHGKTAVVLVVGSHQECEPLFDELDRLVAPTEQVVLVELDDRLFDAMERPEVCPAVGLWSAKGSLVGYREKGESIAEFLEYARRFC